MSLRTRIPLAAAIACAALVIPAASASAEDFCVGTPAGCTGTPVPSPLLASALTQAQSNGTDDRFFLAPGVFDSTNFSHQSVERVQIIGAGAGKTIVRGTASGSVLALGGSQDSSVSDLTLKPIGSASSGLTLQATHAHGVAVDATGAASLQSGVQLLGDATFDNGTVDIGGVQGYAVLVVSGDGTVTDSTLTGPAGAGFATAGGEVAVRRSTLDAKYGAIAASGHLTLTDTLVDLRGNASGGGPNAFGMWISPNLGGNATTVAADADRLTIVGSTPSTSDTAGVAVIADGAGRSAAAHLRDSVISGIGVPVGRQADNGATANLTTSRSAYPSPVASFDNGAGSIVEQARLTVSPHFVDAAGGDFHLAADSPLIDAGTAGAVSAGATDRDGRPRASDGDGDCGHVSDIGAFEYQGTKVTAIASAAASAAAIGQAVGFSAVGPCVPGPEAPTIGWSFDDGATASGAEVAHAFATPGRHTATVSVSDAHGRSAQATASVDVTAAAAPAPSAPRITRLRVAPTRVQIGTALPKLVRTRVKRPLGTIGFRLSQRATVTLRFAKLTSSGKARPVSARIRIKARQGRNLVRFAARLTRTVALKPGAYRLTAVATDTTGLRSKRARAAFTAIKAPRR